jgi:hypothetical protein
MAEGDDEIIIVPEGFRLAMCEDGGFTLSLDKRGNSYAVKSPSPPSSTLVAGAVMAIRFEAERNDQG